MVAICVGNTTARVVGLDSGDVAVYDNHGNKIVLSNQGVTITASKVTVVNSDVIVNGGDVIADGISLKSHTHNESIGTITGVAQ
jgi:phage gp45-like